MAHLSAPLQRDPCVAMPAVSWFGPLYQMTNSEVGINSTCCSFTAPIQERERKGERKKLSKEYKYKNIHMVQIFQVLVHPHKSNLFPLVAFLLSILFWTINGQHNHFCQHTGLNYLALLL